MPAAKHQDADNAALNACAYQQRPLCFVAVQTASSVRTGASLHADRLRASVDMWSHVGSPGRKSKALSTEARISLSGLVPVP